MISVIIPCYNVSKYIRTAIESVLVQNIEKEIILVDDCSNDNTREIIKEYLKMENIVAIYNSKNMGVAASRNLGVQKAKGEYIAYLDADDYWKEDKLIRQMQELKKKKGVLCYTGRLLVTENGVETEKVIRVKETNTYATLCRHNDIPCSSVLVKRSVALEFPMEHDEVHEDYLTWLRILKKYEVACGINEPLLYYRLSENGKSRNRIKSAKMTYGVHRYMGNGRCKAFGLMCMHLINALKKYK